MTDTTMRPVLDLDGGMLRLQLRWGAEILSESYFDERGVEDIVRGFMAVRALMPQPVPGAVDLGTGIVDYLSSPAFVVPPMPPGDGAAFLLRHPGLGWLAILMSREQASQLAHELLRQVGDTEALKPSPSENDPRRD